MADTVPPVAPSDALLSLVLSRAVDAVGRIVDPVRVEEDAVVRLVSQYADVESTHGAALVEAVARRVGSDIDASDVASILDLSEIAGEIAGEIDLSDLADHIDASDVAKHIDASDVAMHIDLAELAREVSGDMLGDVVSSVAEHIDASDVAGHIDLGDVANEVDMSDLAGHIDLDGLVEALDLDDLASRVRRDLPPDVVERIERLEERLALVETVVENETEARLQALERASAGDLVAVQIGPALPAAPAVTSGVLDAVIDRTVDALLAALNAAAASGRL